MTVQPENAPASLVQNGTTVFFCSDRCRERYQARSAQGEEPSAASVIATGRRPPR